MSRSSETSKRLDARFLAQSSALFFPPARDWASPSRATVTPVATSDPRVIPKLQIWPRSAPLA